MECWQPPEAFSPHFNTACTNVVSIEQNLDSLITCIQPYLDSTINRPGKNKLHELRGIHLFFLFSAKLVHFSANFGSLKVQIRNNFKNVMFIACKRCIQHGNILITCQKEEKELILVKYMIYAVLSQFQIFHHLRIFPAKSIFPKFRVHKKMVFSRSDYQLD